jgi:hypothetical protein
MRRIEIFTSGKHTDNAGVTRPFSDADLAASAAAYDPALHEAPLVIGHPKTDAPAYGWVQRLLAQGGRLIAVPAQVRAEFAEQVEAGAYKKVSASFYPPEAARNPKPGVWYLRHVGFLGAQPPAVKGLRPIEFDDADDAVAIDVEFNEAPDPEPKPDPEPTQQETAVSPEEAAALKAQNEALTKQNEALLAAQTKAVVAARTAEHAAFAEKLVGETRLAEADKDRIVAIANVLHPAGEPVEFGEGETSDTLYKKFTEFLESLPARVEFGEQATRERAAGDQQGKSGGAGDDADAVEYAENADPDRVALDKKIRAHMKAHAVDYLTAARAVIK